MNGVISGSQPSESYGNFDLVKRLNLDFADIVVSKWKSRVTGLSVVHLDYDGARGTILRFSHCLTRSDSSHRERLFRCGHRE